MIRFEHVSYHYPQPGRTAPALHDLSLHIDEGELILVVGPSGAGKSTFLRCLNGLVPHFYGGKLSGAVRVAGLDPIALGPQRMARAVGMVFQDPETQFVTGQVEDELAFGMENQALPRPLMRKRVEEVLDQLTVSHLRGRRLETLSGGEKQRIAIAAVMTMHPDVLVLDEPTSQLDPQSAEEVLAAVRRLNEDLGLTVVLAEHRLERVVQFVDRVLYLPGNGEPALLDEPRAVMSAIALNPPLASLAKAKAWRPLPLTVKQARAFLKSSADSRDRSARSAAAEAATLAPEQAEAAPAAAQPRIRVQGVSAGYGSRQALAGASLTVHAGEIVALMGRNGSGKSTLLRLIAGLLKPSRGEVTLYLDPPAAPLDTRRATPEQIVQVLGFVPQNPGALLFKDTVLEELAFTRQGHGLPPDPGADRALLARLGLGEQADRYPRDLSSGQRQRAALAAILVAQPLALLLDEPTRGLDTEQKETLAAILAEWRAAGRAVLLATHDVELAARCADRVILLGEGQVVVDGPTRQVMTGSLVFASQINKLYRDPRYLTVEDAVTP